MKGTLKLLAASITAMWLAMACTRAKAQEAKTAPQGQAEDGYKIAGTVVNAVTGAPLARVNVSLADTRSRARMLAAESDESGHFHFTGLGAGKYSLQGSRSGFLTAGYDQHEQFSTAVVTGPDFATDKLTLRLMPMAMIFGHVLDEAGEPVRNAQVHLYFEDHSGGMVRVNGAGGAQSDDRGYFDIGVLRPGTYFLSASATPWYAVHPLPVQGGGDAVQHVSSALDVAYPTTFYGGATEAESAAPIELKGGDHQEVEIRLSPVPALHLRFHFPQDTSEQQHRIPMPRFLKREFDSVAFVPPGQFRQVGPGEFEIAGIPAGKYDVRIIGGEPGSATEFNEMEVTRDGQDISATQGEAQATLQVTVKLAGEEPAPKSWALGLRDASQRIAAMHQVPPTGQVSFEAVKPGKYAFVIGAPAKPYAVIRVVGAGGNTANNEVTLASGTNLELTVEVAAGEVGVEGVAQKNGKPIAGVMVALVPKDPQAHLDLFRRDQSDFDGTFSLRGVIPGTYTVVAVEDGWGFDWLKAEVLARYVQKGGQTVTVEPNAQGVVRLPEPVVVQPK